MKYKVYIYIIGIISLTYIQNIVQSYWFIRIVSSFDLPMRSPLPGLIN